jgi:hypothetical protein
MAKITAGICGSESHWSEASIEQPNIKYKVSIGWYSRPTQCSPPNISGLKTPIYESQGVFVLI